MVASAKANLDHLSQLEGFKQVVAPFDGVITARNTDIGALINAGSNTAGTELFRIADTGKLRVYVQVPQSYSPAITSGLTAELHFTEHPKQTYTATLVRTAQALDPTARTLLSEFEVDNSKNELLPGGYTDVHIKLAPSPDSVRLPVATLIFRADGIQIATIDATGHAVLKKIELGRDFGKEVEITSGVAPDEQIIINPPDSLIAGQPVKIITTAEQEAAKKPESKKEQKAEKKEEKEKKA
jgi:RND family efflux transporter MFP subunit